MSQKVISVDVGSGFTQFTNGKQEGCFPSLICTAPETLGFGGDDTKTITVDGIRYLIGDNAKSFGDPKNRVSTLHDDWAASPGWQAALYASLVQLGIKSGDQIQLITGLPQSLFEAKKDGVKQKMDGPKSFLAGGQEFKITIDLTVIPQAAGALLHQATKDEAILAEAVGVIDVGTYTTGFSVIDEGLFQAYRSGGCSVGVSQLAEALCSHLEKELGYRVDPAKLPQILMDKTIRHRGERIDVSDQIARQALLVARPMLDKILSVWDGGNDLLIYIAGGGAQYYAEAIKSVVPHAQIMNDSFYAVVRGMHSYLAAKQPAKAA